jgi:hypothetical protein
MTESEERDTRIERAIRRVMGTPEYPAALPPPPETAAAIAHCREAWQLAFDDYMQKNARKDGCLAHSRASNQAGLAYRNVMPPLVGYGNIRDFIACLACGILIGAITADSSGQLLYAAQIALSALSHAPKPGQFA